MSQCLRKSFSSEVQENNWKDSIAGLLCTVGLTELCPAQRHLAGGKWDLKSSPRTTP